MILKYWNYDLFRWIYKIKFHNCYSLGLVSASLTAPVEMKTTESEGVKLKEKKCQLFGMMVDTPSTNQPIRE